jgi:predicted secreted protein
MFMRAWLLAATLTLLATPAMAQSSPAPSPAPASDASPIVLENQNGQTFAVHVGADVTVQLQRNASAGTRWVVSAKPAFLGDPRQAEMALATPRPVVGAPSWQMFIFPVSAAGAGELAFEKQDRTGATLESFTITINAAAQ